MSQNARGRGRYTINSVNSGSPGPSTSGLGTLFQVVTIVGMISLATAQTDSKTYMICSKATQGVLIAPPKFEACDVPTIKNVTEVYVSLFIPKAESYRFEAFRCVRRNMTNCLHNNTDTLSPGAYITSTNRLADANKHIELDYKYHTLSVDKCQEINKTRENLKEIDPNSWADAQISFLCPELYHTATTQYYILRKMFIVRQFANLLLRHFYKKDKLRLMMARF